MDEEKKKKKNKKKRGKQTKAAEDDVSGGVGGTTSLEHNYVDSTQQNHYNHVSGNVDVQASGVMSTVVSLKRQHDDDDGVKSVSLEEKIKELQGENDPFTQREAGLEKQIICLQNEKDSWLEKEVTLEEKIKQLSDEKASWILKGASFEDRIKHLEDEKDSRVLEENSMKEMIGRLNEENTWLQAQVRELEESRGSLVEEKQHLIETISFLQSQLQHLERETSFSVSSTTEMTKHASEHDDLNAQIEAGRVLVEKLVAENAQLVEKVNELYIELDLQNVMAAHSSTAEFDPAVRSGTASTAVNISESVEKMSASSERMESWESIQVADRTSSTNNADSGISAITTIQVEEPPASHEAGESEEIVQVPLDDNEVPESELPIALETEKKVSVPLTMQIQVEEPPASYEAGESEVIVQVPLDDNEVPESELPIALETEKKVSVPLTDAPLIGAPFRLVSFFAKYVSGADLVNKNTLNSGR